MSNRVVAFLLSLMFASPSFAMIRECKPPDLRSRASGKRYIVEFERTAAPQQETLQRFRGDFSRITQPRGARLLNDAQPRIRHEYTKTFFGAAIDTPSRGLAEIERLPYVRAIHEDIRFETHEGGRAVTTHRAIGGTISSGGAGIRVAIIDTGIDYTHPALGGGFGPGFKVAGGYDFAEDDADPIDIIGHGTHVAGIVAADAPGITGVAPKATLYAYKVFNDRGLGFLSWILAAVERAADPNNDGDTSDHADVVNMSLGGAGLSDHPLSRAVDAGTALGIVFCVSAGNSGGTARVTTPGNAATAITVVAYGGRTLATFSSGGPAPKTLAFKPDVAAPGVSVTSTWPGGGTREASGTSMASPHVAGLCALLRELHPDWTPAMIKHALVSTATPMTEQPLRRGGGIVRGDLAFVATVFPDVPGLSLGLDHAAAGTFAATRTIRLTNHGASAQQLTVSSAPITGVTIDIKPATFTIAPGATQQIEFQFAIDNAVFPFDEKNFLPGGDIAFTGPNTSLSIPWGFVRATRLGFEYPEGILADVYARRHAASGATNLFDRYAEIFTVPGAVWDAAVFAFDPLVDGEPMKLRVFTREGINVTGDELLPLKASDATQRFTFDARDPGGTALSLLPQKDGERMHQLTLRMQYHRVPEPGRLDPIHWHSVGFGNVREVYFSPITPRYYFVPYETYVDAEAMRVAAAHHEPIRPETQPATRTVNSSAYANARIGWRRAAHERDMQVCAIAGFSLDFTLFGANCFFRPLDSDVAVDFFSTEDPSNEAALALMMMSETTETPMIRAHEGRILVSSEVNPGERAVSIPRGGEYTVGVGPMHPYFFWGSIGGLLQNVATPRMGKPVWGFAGAMNENRYAERNSANWTMLDKTGNVTGAGVIGESKSIAPAKPGHRYVVTSELPGPGVASRGELDVRFGNDPADLVAPTITMLRILGASGVPTNTLANGEKATLLFAAADFFPANLVVIPLAQGATKVSYRVNGVWRSLPHVHKSTDFDRTGRVPTGDLFEVDLAPVTAMQNTYVDLKIETTEFGGSSMSWTLSPAFVIGIPPPPPRKRRSVH